jgi:hypothetical protein
LLSEASKQKGIHRPLAVFGGTQVLQADIFSFREILAVLLAG